MNKEENKGGKESLLCSAERQRCEVWTRCSVMGYHRPISQYNKGKVSEYKERKFFKEDLALESLKKREELAREVV